MQQNSQLAPGEISLEDAVAAIKADTPSNATVDLAWLANNIDYIQEFRNFKIPLARNATEDEIAERKLMAQQHPGYRVKGITITARPYVRVDVYAKEVLKKTIRDAFRDHTQRELETDAVHSKTTVYDPDNNTSFRVMKSKASGIEKGQSLGNGEVTK